MVERGGVRSAAEPTPPEPPADPVPGPPKVPPGAPLSASGVLLDLATASASLPLVGRWMRPLGAATAMGLWGYRHLPTVAATSARYLNPGAVASRVRGLRGAAGVYEQALVDALVTAATTHPATGTDPATDPDPATGTDAATGTGTGTWRPVRRGRLGPLTAAALHHRYAVQAGVRYGPDPAHRLDIWRRRDLPLFVKAPVLLYLPGGGWVYGSRRLQAHHMLAHLADQGWVCLSADYRVAPHHPWPAHIHDVKRAIVWARECVAGYGGDPEFIALSGCSAGGHLASLAGLTANDPMLQPGFERADTSVEAVVSIYGRYDWENRVGEERLRFMAFLERVVVQATQAAQPETFRAASPIARVHADAPPFLVIHGVGDTIIPVAQARDFVEALRGVSRAPAVYAELPGAGHGFDLMNNQRTAVTAAAVERFLGAVRDRPRAHPPATGRPSPGRSQVSRSQVRQAPVS